jgi:hypothetical protein
MGARFFVVKTIVKAKQTNWFHLGKLDEEDDSVSY